MLLRVKMPDPPAAPHVYTVTSITQVIRDLILGSQELSDVWVEGEISDLKVYPSGHAYLTLKDDKSIIRCMVWSGTYTRISDALRCGEGVILRGRIDIYAEKGVYQLYVTDAKSKGKGELYLRFEELKRRLKEEGLFDRKRGLPAYPRRIGVVTSPEGAAFHDIIEGFERRYPCVEIILYPVRVQGKGAAEEVAEGIRALGDPTLKVDLIIIARGGGSAEDLWAFNEECVARALYDSPVPTVSAVGHETDFTISDFVADVRAGTPSKAAEVVAPDREGLLREISQCMRSITFHAERKYMDSLDRLETILTLLRPADMLLASPVQSLSELNMELFSCTESRVTSYQNELDVLCSSLLALDPHKIVQKGFAIIRKEGKYISSVAEISVEDQVDVIMKDGESLMEVKSIREAKP
jgi:exodeoxyribonuclease VII large subunit